MGKDLLKLGLNTCDMSINRPAKVQHIHLIRPRPSCFKCRLSMRAWHALSKSVIMSTTCENARRSIRGVGVKCTDVKVENDAKCLKWLRFESTESSWIMPY